MDFAKQKLYKISTQGVDFIKVGRTAQNIEIALSIYALRLRPTFKELFTNIKDWCKAQKIGIGHKTVYEIDPRLLMSDFNRLNSRGGEVRDGGIKGATNMNNQRTSGIFGKELGSD